MLLPTWRQDPFTPSACLPAVQAAGGAASRMKPQEVANTCWAWATLRYFPGAAAMDAMLAAAGEQSIGSLGERSGPLWEQVVDGGAAARQSHGRTSQSAHRNLTPPPLFPSPALQRRSSTASSRRSWATWPGHVPSWPTCPRRPSCAPRCRTSRPGARPPRRRAARGRVGGAPLVSGGSTAMGSALLLGDGRARPITQHVPSPLLCRTVATCSGPLLCWTSWSAKSCRHACCPQHCVCGLGTTPLGSALRRTAAGSSLAVGKRPAHVCAAQRCPACPNLCVVPRRPPLSAAAGREAVVAATRKLHAGDVYPAIPGQDEPQPAGGCLSTVAAPVVCAGWGGRVPTGTSCARPKARLRQSRWASLQRLLAGVWQRMQFGQHCSRRTCPRCAAGARHCRHDTT